MDYEPTPLDKLALELFSQKEAFFEEQPVSPDFWKIKNACATKETGRYFPQVKELNGTNLSLKGTQGSVYNFDYNFFPEEPIDFGILKLYKQAKLSDTISASIPSGDGFYLSEKAKKVFSAFNLGCHKYYPLKVEHLEKKHTYYWLQLKVEFNSFINFSKSVFFENVKYGGPKTIVQFKNKQEMMDRKALLRSEWTEKKRKLTYVEYKELFLNKDFPAVDLFSFETLGIDLYISKKLKDAIELENLTGFEISEQRRVFLDR